MDMDARSAPPSLPGGPARPAGAPAGPLSAGVRFAGGFLLPFRAIGLILAHRALRRWSLLAGLVSAVLLAALVVGLVAFTGDLLGLIWARPAGWVAAVWYLVAALLFGLLFVLGASTVPTVATAPFLDPLSADTERILGGGPAGGGLGRMVAETANAVGKAVIRIALLLAGHGALLLLWLLPGIGQGLWSAAALAWTVLWLAFEYLDVPANRHGYRFRDTLRLLWANAPAAAGLGLAIYLVLWIPLLNAFFVPVGAVAATALFVQVAPR
jgi:CysZ protein